MDIRELLKQGPVLFDGAMGTYMAKLLPSSQGHCENISLQSPQIVEQIHKEYIDAGAMAITTNTFAANRSLFGEEQARKIIDASLKIARDASEGRACIFASIGPVAADKESAVTEYKWMIDRLIEAGCENFIFETQYSMEAVKETAAYIKKIMPTAYVITDFSVGVGAYTSDGLYANDLLRMIGDDINIDAGGFNCALSAGHMNELADGLDLGLMNGKPFVIMPNAGYPVIVGRKAIYEGDPEFFAKSIAQLITKGAYIVGGCCGTTPVHIKAAREELDLYAKDAVSANKSSCLKNEKDGKNIICSIHSEKQKAFDLLNQRNLSNQSNIADSSIAYSSDLLDSKYPSGSFWHKLSNGLKPIAVELDPPKDADISGFLKGASELKNSNVDIITIADCPIARARMDSSILACKLRRDYQIEAIPHLTCRDRNLNATQALMMGLYAEGIRNMLLVTGDPVPDARREEVKTVFQFNSRKLAAFASSLNENYFSKNAHFYGALNVNAKNFDVQIKLAKEKEKNGMSGFFTQPVLTREAFDNLKRAKDELDGYILGGIIPVVSERNARFMNSEINGINVAEEVIELYIGKERAEAEKIAIDISAKIAREMSPYIDGYYIITPFQRTSIIKGIIERMRQF